MVLQTISPEPLMRRSLSILAVLAAVLIPGLAHSASPAGTWRLASLADLEKFDASKTELTIAENGQASMTVGCNRMRSTATVGDGSLKFSPIMTTRMNCLPPLMELEFAFQNAIGRTTSYKIAGKTLTLIDASQNVVATFTRKE